MQKSVNMLYMDAILSKVKSKSRFLKVLENALKEDGTTATAPTNDPNVVQQTAQQAATAQQTSGQQNAAAVTAANNALLAAIKAHPELNGDISKLSDPTFIQNLTKANTSTASTAVAPTT